jgi:hypothetical protein
MNADLFKAKQAHLHLCIFAIHNFPHCIHFSAFENNIIMQNSEVE